MATQISGVCENIVISTLIYQNSVSVNEDVIDISIIQPQIEITLACLPSVAIPEGFLESFTDTEEVVVNHFMGKKPAATVIDSIGQEVKVQIVYNNDNQFTASWHGVMSGTISAN